MVDTKSMLHRMPKVGDKVVCPADRRDFPHPGVIESVGEDININIHGVKYVWCNVRVFGHASVWPSHRLGYYIEEK